MLDETGAIRQRYDVAEARWTPQGCCSSREHCTPGADGVFVVPPGISQQRVDFSGELGAT